jgi:FkbM family methyltransferase
MGSATAARHQGAGVDTRLDPRRPATAELFLALPGEVAICVTNDLASVTTYVLAEQEDWFEPELGFLRRWFGPGMRAIDVGANHGIYALTLARLAGPDGLVVAVEPGGEVARRLERAIAHNGVGCRLVRAAIADTVGAGTLHHRGGSELASLLASGAGAGEPVAVTTLDALWRELGEPPLDFVKLDVEGFEPQALRGAARLLAQASPLVMLEISGDPARLPELIPPLAAQGYDLYRLLPETGVLVPLVPDELSAFQLNILACRPERAAQLEAAGLLVPADAVPPPPASPSEARAALTTLACWAGADPAALDALAPGSPLLHALRSRRAAPATAIGDQRRVATDPGLDGSGPAGVALLASLARCAAALGWRERALGALGQLDGALVRGAPAELPFLPVLPRYDAIDPGPDRAEWLRLMTVEGLVLLHCHSTRFGRGDALGLLERWRHSRFFSAALERRRQLLSIRFGLQAGLLATEPLRREPGLNRDLYR